MFEALVQCIKYHRMNYDQWGHYRTMIYECGTGILHFTIPHTKYYRCLSIYPLSLTLSVCVLPPGQTKLLASTRPIDGHYTKHPHWVGGPKNFSCVWSFLAKGTIFVATHFHP